MPSRAAGLSEEVWWADRSWSSAPPATRVTSPPGRSFGTGGGQYSPGATLTPPGTRLADELGGLDVAVADVEHPASVHALLGHGDVLVTAVGPYLRFGGVAVEAAVDAGAHYLDASGEGPFIRRVFEEVTDRGRNVPGARCSQRLATTSCPETWRPLWR